MKGTSILYHQITENRYWVKAGIWPQEKIIPEEQD
jgi:hypothetical protein